MMYKNIDSEAINILSLIAIFLLSVSEQVFVPLRKLLLNKRKKCVR